MRNTVYGIKDIVFLWKVFSYVHIKLAISLSNKTY